MHVYMGDGSDTGRNEIMNESSFYIDEWMINIETENRFEKMHVLAGKIGKWFRKLELNFDDTVDEDVHILSFSTITGADSIVYNARG